VRPPAVVIVIDAAILVAAVRGKSHGAVVEAARHAALATTDRAVSEVTRRIALGMKRPDLLPLMDELVHHINIASVSKFGPAALADAERTLREAPAGRNGAVNDAHILVLAWGLDADIWSTDRNFAGVGVACWSTPNLLRAFARVAARKA
jgi:predicted nucleic acid-binding protein